MAASRKRLGKSISKSANSISKKAAVRSSDDIPDVAKAPPVVGIGASAGGLEAFTELLCALPANTEMAFVFEESLRNVHKHSQSVKVRLEGGRQGVSLRIEDAVPGGGFDLGAALRKGGLGLFSMEERFRLANGQLRIQSRPVEGTVVTAFIRLGKKPAATKAT